MTDESFVPVSEHELAAYVAHYFERYDEKQRDGWTGGESAISQLVYDLVDDGRTAEAWRIVLALINGAPTRPALGFVAADTLELLMRYPTTTDDVCREIVDEARGNARVREAFGLVYWGRGEPDWFRDELAALGVNTCH